MKTLGLSGNRLVQLWERARGRHSLDRALLVLTSVSPESTWDQLADLPIGVRDRLLLQLRIQTFGSELVGFSECERCHEGLEMTLDATDLLLPADAREEDVMEIDGRRFHLRGLTSRDLGRVAGAESPEAARSELLRLVLTELDPGPQSSTPRMGVEDIAVASELLARIDPQADVVFEVQCPECAHEWELPFDIAGFLWAEIEAQVRRLVREVAALAQVYHWSESEILNMSGVRRQAYLDMTGA